jgi:hypothetical protein
MQMLPNTRTQPGLNFRRREMTAEQGAYFKRVPPIFQATVK